MLYQTVRPQRTSLATTKIRTACSLISYLLHSFNIFLTLSQKFRIVILIGICDVIDTNYLPLAHLGRCSKLVAGPYLGYRLRTRL